MDYKDKYNKLVNAIKVLQETNPSDEGIQNWVKDNVPELQESDDERIMKCLITIIKIQKEGSFGLECNHGASWNEMLSWLEKQGHTDGIIEKAKTEKQRVIITETDGNANIDWDTRSLADTKMLLEYGLDFINKKFEKQGEQKSFDYENATIVPKDFAPKEEPKFHEGDWVILTAGELSTTLLIVNVDTSKRLYWFNDSSYLPIVDEECLHHWKPQDAKDGDVLQLGKVTAIFKEFIANGNCRCYCSVWEGKFEIPSQDDDDSYGCYNMTPATKEQRDLLFYKMKGSGYEWDAEKKEFKLLITNGGDFCESENSEQNPADWSEYDERMCQNILECLRNGWRKLPTDILKYESWFKFIKQRYTWKPSKEQIRTLEYYMHNLVCSEHKEVLFGLYEQLKKLKGE